MMARQKQRRPCTVIRRKPAARRSVNQIDVQHASAGSSIVYVYEQGRSFHQPLTIWQMKAVTALGGVAERTGVAAGEWLRSLPRGAYTTARTVDSTQVLLWQKHVQRLQQSSQSILSETAANDVTELRVLQPLQSALSALRNDETSNTCHDDTKITLLLTESEGNELEARCHVAPLPLRASPPVSVFIEGSGRQNARAKDSDWISARKPLEDAKPPECEEVILLGDDHDSLLEGLSSNFFAVQNGTVQTASEGVLEGTIKSIVLDVCHESGIQVDGSLPRLSEASTWDGAFITSTSRLVLPIGRMQPANGDTFDLPQSSSLLSRIEQLVESRVRDLSEEVVGKSVATC